MVTVCSWQFAGEKRLQSKARDTHLRLGLPDRSFDHFISGRNAHGSLSIVTASAGGHYCHAGLYHHSTFRDHSDVCLLNSATSRAVSLDPLLPKRDVT